MGRLPIPKFARYDFRANFGVDFSAAAAVAFLAVPQGLAYATIAGLPPATGLYASAIPAIVGSLMRSSRHVVAGPTNALSLLVGAGIIASTGRDPVETALTLALMVGLFQVAAGFLRLGAIVDFISSPVVLGYITGAGLLIGIGQLYNVTGTAGKTGRIWVTVGGWIQTLPDAAWMSVVMALGTVLLVLGLRVISKKIGRRIPAAIVATTVALLVNVVLGLESQGLKVVSDLSPIPRGLPTPSLPLPKEGWSGVIELLPVAVACTVLSLVESSAVARSVATRSGQRLESSTEFAGQGFANLAAAFFGGYPVSGSLTRSALNQSAGAQTRVAGMISGVIMLGILVALGPVLNHTPVSSLAGLLLVVAVDLVDVPRIRKTLSTSWPDAIAFTATLIGTWVLSLDMAIYVGVGISVVAVLRRARMLRITELIVAEDGRLKEVVPGEPDVEGRDSGVRILHVEGALFFGAAGELQSALDDAIAEPEVKVVVLRLKRTSGLDATIAAVLEAAAIRLHEQGQHMLIAGLKEDAMAALIAHGAAATIGDENLFLTRQTWLSALAAARRRAVALADPEGVDRATETREPAHDQARLPTDSRSQAP